jgi:hypothetical protein
MWELLSGVVFACGVGVVLISLCVLGADEFCVRDPHADSDSE